MRRSLEDWIWIVATSLICAGLAATSVAKFWPTAPLVSWQGAFVVGWGLVGGALIYWQAGR